MQSSIPILSSAEIKKMKKAGQIAAELKCLLIKKAQPGVTTQELDTSAEEFIRQQGATPAFKGYHNYPATLVTSINEQVVHAIPSQRQLKEGDLLTIDLGANWQGYNSDTAISFVVGEPEKETRFLLAGKTALDSAIAQCRPGKHIGDISYTIQNAIEKAGYSVVRIFTGHGIGREVHQPPEIPCFGEKGTGPELLEGVGLAVEVMYTKGSAELKILEDRWTAVTTDGKLSSHFEDTVIVTADKPLITTR
ncbi:type I methionyl aminopeptidase [Patescibacteria group bacterium]|nr:type I methionyl aminopeptidase [Patescibacteria group bacterium]MBU1867865.1 type I methionyl aminopeptidase [Patescibacteria group bacterium]